MTLPGGTIGGNIQRIALGGPDRCIHKPVQQLIGTFEKAGLLNIGINSYCCYILGMQFDICFHFRILKSEYSKGGFVFVQPFPAGVDNLLQGTCLFFVDTLDIL